MAGAYWLTVRDGPRVRRESFGSLESALEALEASVDELSKVTRRRPINVGVRKFEPIQQVAARAELVGPGRLLGSVHGGVDIRGDGSVEPYLGRFRRRVIERAAGESACAALRRAIAEDGGG
ncbi:MAG TPA: hypothetical protein VHE14_06810 [Solirubrobacteraceae bacterium]|nr:hypothetical protein [Solirubrobacteraceae bacterium]